MTSFHFFKVKAEVNSILEMMKEYLKRVSEDTCNYEHLIQSFSQVSNMNTHVKRYHSKTETSKIEKEKCDTCGKQFEKSKGYLKEHIKIVRHFGAHSKAAKFQK